MSDDHIRYDVLVQEALRGVVRKVITEVVRTNVLPGEHHFYVTFDTNAPGVRISSRIREQYPEEMTVVLQHQFWDLIVTEHTFEVGLSFGGIPERLLIPFSAIKGFFDPSVQFSLQFEVDTEAKAANDSADQENPGNDQLVVLAEKDETTDSSKGSESGSIPEVKPQTPLMITTPSDPDEDGKEKTDDDKSADGSAEVVSLDSFRKKP